MDDFLLTIGLRAPMISNHPISLDGYVGGALFRDGVPGPQAALTAPIDRWNGVPMASEVFFDTDYVLSTRSFNRSFARGIIINPWIHADMVGKRPLSMGTNADSNAEDRTIGTTHTVVEVTRIYFVGRGDQDAIGELIERHPFIGARRAGGYGEIEGFSFEPYEAGDGDIAGIVHKGKLLRAVPENLRQMLPEGTKARTTHGMWHSPYHPGEAVRLGYTPEIILRPDQRRLEMDHEFWQ